MDPQNPSNVRATFDSSASFESRNLNRLATSLAADTRRHRTRIDRISTWAVAHGSTEGDQILLTLVLEARRTLEEQVIAAHTRGHYWTRTQTNELLTRTIPTVCRLLGCHPPDGTAEQLWLVLHHLHAEGLMHFDSDPIGAVCEPLHCFAALDDRGRRTDAWGWRHDVGASDGPPGRRRPCRCYWPTAKQIDLGLEEPPPIMPSRFDWYEPERRRAEREWAHSRWASTGRDQPAATSATASSPVPSSLRNTSR